MTDIKPPDAATLTRLNQRVEIPVNQDPEKAAAQFEGLLIQEMLKSMWQTVPNGRLLSGSSEEQTYRDMLNQAIAESVAEGKGIGIKDVILKDFKKLEKSE